MATTRVRRTEAWKDEEPQMASWEREGLRSSAAIKDGKKESMSGSKFGSRESGSSSSTSSRVRSQQGNKKTGVAADDGGAQLSVTENRFSSVSLPRRLLRTSMAPILSLKRVGITKDSTGQFVVFLLRVAALEAIRRVSRGRCPQVWWGLQGISLLQAPPFSWFQRWAPLRHLVEGTQSFSKPLIFLSLATAVSSAVEEIQHASDPNLLDRVLAPPQDSSEERIGAQSADSTQTEPMDDLRQALAKAAVDLPERFGDEDLQNFLVASNGNFKRFVTKVRKSINWRQTYYFLNSEELKQWSHFVSWHDYDSKSRPLLIIRLGPAYSCLEAHDRPRFCQAVVSQMEYGVLHLLNYVDPRITVIMDCKGTTAIGFPVHMMKSCAVLVQDNFPTRLAALFAINLPPVVRVVANAVMQVVGQTTREKLHLLGDVYLTALSDLVGGTDKVPASVGGACHCPDCMEERRAGTAHQVSYDNTVFSYGGRRREVELEEDRNTEEPTYEEDLVTNYQSYNNVLRIAIVGFLMLWILIALVAGLHEPDLLPT